MITPAYAPTATERVLPKLALDFTTGTLDPRVTVTRALNTATRINSSGLVEGINAGLPRFDYDPVTRLCNGLLIEESRDNLLLSSGNLTSATYWTSGGLASLTQNVAAPDGTLSSATLTEDASTGLHGLIAAAGNRPTLTGGTTYTLSVRLKAGTRRYVVVAVATGTLGFGVTVDTNTWTITEGTAGASGSTYVGSSIKRTASDHYIVTVSGSFTVNQSVVTLIRGSLNPTGNSNFAPNYTGNSSTIIAWGAQLEPGAFATSYIPTTTTSLTRNADVVSMTGANFSDWYNASEGTFVARFLSYVGASVNSPRILAVSDGSTANRLRSFLATTNTTTQVNSGGVSQASLNNTPSTLYGTFNKLAIGYKADRFVTAINGGAVSSDLSGSVPVAPIRLNIGADFDAAAATQLNGYLSLLNYYPQCLTNAETQAFSK